MTIGSGDSRRKHVSIENLQNKTGNTKIQFKTVTNCIWRGLVGATWAAPSSFQDWGLSAANTKTSWKQHLDDDGSSVTTNIHSVHCKLLTCTDAVSLNVFHITERWVATEMDLSPGGYRVWWRQRQERWLPGENSHPLITRECNNASNKYIQ